MTMGCAAAASATRPSACIHPARTPELGWCTARDSPMMTVMGATKMHADEIETDPARVRRLLARQFPRWADLPIVPVVSDGTDHDIYRLGDHLAVRLPRIAWATGQ